MLESKKPLIFVGASRNKGYSEKKQKDYDIATIEVSDGIGSLDLPLDPSIHLSVVEAFNRGDKVKIEVDVRKEFGRSQFIVSCVIKAS